MSAIARPLMTDGELAFLEAHIKPEYSAWEWGAGGSTFWLAKRCRWLTTVEHQARFAQMIVATCPQNVSLIYAPPNLPYEEGTEDDGDRETFRRYVTAFRGGDSVDVVLIDGRARVACAREVSISGALHPDLRVFVHDANRTEYERIWMDDPKWGDGYMVLIERIGNLAMLGPRL